LYDLSSGGISANAWHHLAVTMKDSNRQLPMYVDGVQKAQGTLASDSSAGNTRPVRIGRNGGTATAYWVGKLDDIRIWNVVRTAAEVSANYHTELTSAPTGFVANWKVNEGTGTTAADSAGTAQSATLQGGVTWSTDVHP